MYRVHCISVCVSSISTAIRVRSGAVVSRRPGRRLAGLFQLVALLLLCEFGHEDHLWISWKVSFRFFILKVIGIHCFVCVPGQCGLLCDSTARRTAVCVEFPIVLLYRSWLCRIVASYPTVLESPLEWEKTPSRPAATKVDKCLFRWAQSHKPKYPWSPMIWGWPHELKRWCILVLHS